MEQPNRRCNKRKLVVPGRMTEEPAHGPPPVVAASVAAASRPSALALGWTRVQRRRTRPTTTTDQGPESCGSPRITNDERNQNKNNNNNNDANEESQACTDDDAPDEYCFCARHNNASSSSLFMINQLFETAASRNRNNHVVVSGTVLALLLEPNPDWFQAYLFPNNNNNNNRASHSLRDDFAFSSSLLSSLLSSLPPSSRPWGILAVQQTDLDECLRCADGGYRRVHLTVYPPSPRPPSVTGETTTAINTTTTTMTAKKQKAATTTTTIFHPTRSKKTNSRTQPTGIELEEAVEWTGGDMMRLQSILSTTTTTTASRSGGGGGGGVRMVPDRVVLGKRALPFVKHVFTGLWNRMVRGPTTINENDHEEEPSSDEEEDDDDDMVVLNLFPDVAVVIGTMEIMLPDNVQGWPQQQQDDENQADW